MAGTVFTVLHGKIEIGASCFLASDSLLLSATLLPAQRPAEASACDADVRQRLASSRSRRVVNCWPIARMPAGRRLLLVEFERRDKDALASVVPIDRGRIVFADYPAVFRGQGEDLWRVDDGGALSPKGFQVVFLLQRGTFNALGVDWSGSEGTSLAVFVSNGDKVFARVTEDYWYQAPV